jgi:toxin YoeB
MTIGIPQQLRRLNSQHRLIYQVLEQERIVKLLRMWSHYDLTQSR